MTLLEQALAIKRKTLGPAHLSCAASFINLASINRRLGKDAEAEQLFREALALDERILGPQHIILAADLSGLAEF